MHAQRLDNAGCLSLGSVRGLFVFDCAFACVRIKMQAAFGVRFAYDPNSHKQFNQEAAFYDDDDSDDDAVK